MLRDAKRAAEIELQRRFDWEREQERLAKKRQAEMDVQMLSMRHELVSLKSAVHGPAQSSTSPLQGHAHDQRPQGPQAVFGDTSQHVARDCVRLPTSTSAMEDESQAMSSNIVFRHYGLQPQGEGGTPSETQFSCVACTCQLIRLIENNITGPRTVTMRAMTAYPMIERVN
jgi:hypothetical protein